MQKENQKKLEKNELERKNNKSNNQQDMYYLYFKSINNNIQILQKMFNSHLSIKEKSSKEKINLYFSQIFSTLKLLLEEKNIIISKYESILRISEEKVRILYSDIFNLKIKNTFLENNIDILLKKEKEYRLVKEKIGVIVENGKIVYNDRKENEIFILRTENSTLKNEILKNEREISEIKVNYSYEKENYEKQILNLNHKISQLKYKLRQYNPKIKEQSSSSINIKTNDTSNPNLKLNFTVNNSLNKVNISNALTNGINNSNINDANNLKNYNNNKGIKRKYESILLNKKKKKKEKILINSDRKINGLNHWQSSEQLNLKNKMINKLKKLNKEETKQYTFHKELNLSNLNVSPIHSRKILCLTPQNNNYNPGLNYKTFQKIIDLKKKNKIKMIHKSKMLKNCLSNQNVNKSNNLYGIKVLYKNNSKNKTSKNNISIKNKKLIKKELTWSKNLIINNSVSSNSRLKINKKNKISYKSLNNKEINKTNIIKSPKINFENNKRKRNLISNIREKENKITNKTSLSSIRRKNTINTSINSYNKNIFNS